MIKFHHQLAWESFNFLHKLKFDDEIGNNN